MRRPLIHHTNPASSGGPERKKPRPTVAEITLLRWWIKQGASRDLALAAVHDAPAEVMPVYVRAGSIVPTGPVMQYTDEKPDAPLTILVYPGANGSFSLYEDDGRSHQFEKGAFSRIPFAYDDATGTLTIGARQGSYKGMVANRQIIVRWMKDGSGIDGTDGLSAPLAYSGRAVTVKRP